MANGLRAKLSKLRHDGHITDVEYKSFIKKDGWHDAEIRAKAIDEFVERLKEEIIKYDCPLDMSDIDKIAEQLKGGAV